MKKAFVLLLAAAGLARAQESQSAKLENIYKVEVGIQGISAGAEIPLGKNFLADLNVGWGGTYDFSDGLSYSWQKGSSSAFARGQVRYYLNRERREDKGRSLKNNAGTFIAYQTKYIFSKTSNANWLNEVQFGQQLPMWSHFIFRYQAGLGVAVQRTNKSNVYPALGFALGYAF